ncbi:MAG: hypothetical protein AAFX52_00050 [Pseudomonadota bacterium]
MKNLFAIAAATLMAFSASNAATMVVDVDSQPTDNGVTVSLGAGSYDISFVDGLFNGWNAWGRVTGCETDGTGCSRGWLTNVNIDVEDTTYKIGRHGKFETPEQALANASPFELNLSSLTDVTFYIADSYFSDNIGGVSLEIASVATPIPGAGLLFIAGAAVYASSRRKRLAP